MELCNTPNVLEMTSTQNFLARFGFISKGISSRKRNELEKLELFEKEKKRLNLLGGKKKLPGRENYKKELNTIVAKGKSLAVNG